MAAVAVVVAAVAAQDGMDDLQDMDSMLAPPGQEGGEAQAARPRVTELTMIQQTTLALQQLGIVIGVAFMVAFLFMVMIGIEKPWDKAESGYQSLRGKPPPQEVDPASLVGTFSRYK